ncbi:MAG: sulfite oxidase [Desulfosarcina sp.]|jgi:DMSO/TMAO reductase YedYZ molybdopterin-dependent catalytic subunit
MMDKNMRVMTESPLNAETPVEKLRTWITTNSAFFKRNQGLFPKEPVDLAAWSLSVEGLVNQPLHLTFEDILELPKVEIANTLECSGNGRSLLKKKASGNPWTIGGVGNALWGGVLLKALLDRAGLKTEAKHVCFEGFDVPKGKAQIKFVRSIPVEKALHSTLLAYEMNGEPLPLQHGFPMRALALGWTGANCVKWLNKITLLKDPANGFYMDRVYRIFQKGEDPSAGEVVTKINIKSIITQPISNQRMPIGVIPIRGAAYAGEESIEQVEVSTDNGRAWNQATLIGLKAPFAWRQWEYLWEAKEEGTFTIMSRAISGSGARQPQSATWNALGYGNNGIDEHAVTIHIASTA